MFDETQLNNLYRYSLSLCNDSDEAYDLLYNNIEKYLKSNQQQIDNIQAYMKRCIRNTFFDLQRHKKIRLIKSEQLSNDYEEIQQELNLLENNLINQKEVSLLLKELNPEESELLYLWAVEGYTAQEIADMQGSTRNTCLSRIHRIKIKLRKSSNSNHSQQGGESS